MVSGDAAQGASPAALLYGTDLYKGAQGLTNESIILKTKSLALRTLSKLDFRVSYFIKGNVLLSEAYKAEAPINVLFDSTAASVPYGVEFRVDLVDNNTYTLSTENLVWQEKVTDKTFLFGKSYLMDGFAFTINLLKPEPFEGNEVLFVINDLDDLAKSYASNLSVAPYGGDASALVLTLTGTTPKKDIDYLNAHMVTYAQNNLAIKNADAVNTLSFIDQQLQDRKSVV